MIEIIMPNNNINERKYIIDVIFNEFLGISYNLKISDTCYNWIIVISNTKKIVIKDHFFNKHSQKLDYLNKDNIPSAIKYTNNDFCVEKDIPIIYGTVDFDVSCSEINCGIDILASSFFMLTRWEENVNKNRDIHDRFAAIDSLAYKNGFLDRPIVNEYVEMLWRMLFHLEYTGIRKSKVFETKVSHDVDSPIHARYFDVKRLLRSSAKALVKERKPIKAISYFSDFINYKYLNRYNNDSVNTFEFFMDISEKYNIKSNFYFKTDCTDTKYDEVHAGYDKYIIPIMQKISDRGHFIGLHPSYNTYLDIDQTNKEYLSLQSKTNQINHKQEIIGGRQHYLMFSAPDTWINWDKQGLDYDSTLGYADIVGFRCGVCYPYTVFDFINRKHLKLKEYPLIVMEGTVFGYMNLDHAEGLQKMKILKDVCRNYDGIFTLLWHNSFLEKKEYFDIYEEIVSY